MAIRSRNAALSKSWSTGVLFICYFVRSAMVFSAQKAIQSKASNLLLSEREKKLMFVRWNLRLFSGFGPELAKAIDKLPALADVALTGAVVEEDEDDAVMDLDDYM